MPGEALRWLQEQGLDTPAMRRKHGLVADAEAVAHGLAMTRLLLEIHRLLEAEAIDHFFVKGPALSMQLYGDPTKRRCGDIDVFVGSEVRAAVRHLERAGFVVETPAIMAPQLLRRVNAVAMTRGSERVEVHQDLFSAPYRGFERDLRLERTTAVIDGVQIPTVQGDDYLRFLVRHGGKHYWRRLVWLQDVLDWKALQPAPIVGPFADTFVEAGQGLAGSATTGWSAQADWAVPADRRWGRWRLFAYLWKASPLRVRMSMVLALAHPTVVDHHRWPLPRRAHGLYWLLRPVRLLIDLGRSRDAR